MGTNFNRAQDLCPGANIDSVSNPGKPASTSGPNSNLLKNKAIYTNNCVGMNHDAIRMRDKKAASYIAVEWNIGAGDDTPKTMA